MKYIFECMSKYWYLELVIIVLLVAQAFCDLSLPDYTSSLIDIGISGSGVEHVLPEVMTDKGYTVVNTFLNDEEKKTWETIYSYDSNAGYYVMSDSAKADWDGYDQTFCRPIAIVFSMMQQAGDALSDIDMSKFGDMSGMDFSNMDMSQIDMSQIDMSEVDMGTILKLVKLKETLEQLGVDITSKTLMLDLRYAFEEQMSVLGDNMIVSMGRNFAKQEYIDCGMDINKIQSDYLWRVGGKMLTMALLMTTIAILVGFFASKVGAGVGRNLRLQVFSKVMGFSSAELDNFSTATLITRNTNDVQQIQIVSVILLRVVLYAPILAIGGIINITKYKSGMAWIIVLAIALVVSLIMVLLVVVMPKFKVMQQKVDNVNLVAREILTGLQVIRAFSREKREEERFDKVNTDLTDVMLFTNRSMAVMMPAMMIVMNGVSVLIVWVAAHKIDAGVLEVGSMTAFITYAFVIIMGFLMITMVSIMLPRAGVAANRIKELIDTEELIKDKENAMEEAPSDATVVFDHVSFKYPDGEENAISDITFTAKKGETTAIIGSTGCGKSTLIKLIPRLFDVTEGSITLGGVDLRDIKIKTLRKQIGYVPQKGILFSGDINYNIGYGAPGIDSEGIKEAASIAQAAEFISQKDDGYESMISQGGSNVSGGQKQRLSIARAIARNPKVYIFDDSFSALDFKTDVQLRKALSKKTKDSTVIIVAQRVNTIMNAEQIIVLDEGKMIGKGTHSQLIESCETYRQIAQSQLSEEEFKASLTKSVKEGE